jgi:hypothetical protein
VWIVFHLVYLMRDIQFGAFGMTRGVFVRKSYFGQEALRL